MPPPQAMHRRPQSPPRRQPGSSGRLPPTLRPPLLSPEGSSAPVTTPRRHLRRRKYAAVSQARERSSANEGQLQAVQSPAPMLSMLLPPPTGERGIDFLATNAVSASAAFSSCPTDGPHSSAAVAGITEAKYFGNQLPALRTSAKRGAAGRQAGRQAGVRGEADRGERLDSGPPKRGLLPLEHPFASRHPHMSR